jgi:RNA polymerase sigma-70 factor (ECF subfamily)
VRHLPGMSRRLALRHERAFGRIYRRHVADVYRYALAVLRDPEDAEQVTRTTFRNAYHGLRRARKPDLSWLLSIAHDVCRRRVGGVAGEALAALEDPTADDIRRALRRLPFDQRAALAMLEVEGRSYGEIARLLEIATDDVATLIFQARRSLGEHVDAALTCHEAQLSLSRDLDGQSTRRERRLLREHLGYCVECNAFAADQQAQRAALRELADVPLPRALAEDKFFRSAASL